MGLIQLLKTLSDQDSQADTQAQIETLRDAIVMVDNKIVLTWWILFAMICATVILIVYLAFKFDKRLDRQIIRMDIIANNDPAYLRWNEWKEKRKSRERLEKEVLLNDVSGITGKKSSVDEFLKQG